MKLYQMADGGVLASAREYDIAAGTAIKEGQVVKMSGVVISATVGETGAILGVAAESHSGQADALSPRENGTGIMVYDAPGAIFQCAAPEVTVTSGTATTLVATGIAAFANDDFNGGFVKLMRKAANSTNADLIGQVRRITDFVADSKTFTIESGGVPYAGDVYAVFPPIGFAKGNLNADRTGLVLTATASLALKVVGRDLTLDKINVKARKHTLAEIE